MRRLLAIGAAVVALASSACSDETHDAHTRAERPTLTVTKYASGLELFMEYPAFVAGEESPLVAHFTDARDPNAFHPVTAGSVSAIVRYADGVEQRFTADAPLRDGVFEPVVKPSRAEDATLTLALKGPQVSGEVDVGTMVVHPAVEAAHTAASRAEDDEPTVAFLKEQQWKTDYATAAATVRELHATVAATGELKPVAGRSAELSSPIDGRIVVGESVPHLGQRVRASEVLLTVAPTSIAADRDLPSLEAAVSHARTALGVAERELGRGRELFKLRAIPEKQLDAARAARDTAAATLTAAERQLAAFRGVQGAATGSATNGFAIRSPIDGVVSFADVTPGAVITAGTRLVAVVDTDRLWLDARVYEQDAGRVGHSPGAEFTVAGVERAFIVDEANGRRVAVGAVIDPATRTVPIVFEFGNPGGLKPGMFAKVRIRTGAPVRAVAIPESAVVDDDGIATAFVLKTGETFAKRRVRLGERSDGWVRVLDGVREGERVVSRGAYEIKLASASGAIPAHGHQH